MGTPVLTAPASPPPTTPPANHVCHRPPRCLPPPLHGRCPQPAPRHRGRLPSCCPPLPPSLTLTLLPSSSEPALPPSVLPGPELESAPPLAPSSSDMPGTPPRGHGTLLSYDGSPPALRLLSTGCVECRHLAPEARLLFLSARCTAQRSS